MRCVLYTFFLMLLLSCGQEQGYSRKKLYAVAEKTFPNSRKPPWGKRSSEGELLVAEGGGFPRVFLQVKGPSPGIPPKLGPNVTVVVSETRKGKVECLRLSFQSKVEPGSGLIDYYYVPLGSKYTCLFSMIIPPGIYRDGYEKTLETYVEGFVTRYIDAL